MNNLPGFLRSHLWKGLLIALFLLAHNIISISTSLKNADWFAYVPSPFLILSVGLSVYVYRLLTGPQKFGDLFAHGFKVAATVASIMVLYTWLSVQVFFPQLKVEARAATLDYLSKQPNTLPGNLEADTDKAMKAYLPTQMSMVLMSTLLVGAAGAALGAAVSNTVSTNQKDIA
jgi:hypothetical protein